MPLLIGTLVLWGSTIAIILVDKSMRSRRVATDGDDIGAFTAEPGWGGLIALSILLNLVALPYYFFATRRSALWGFVGFLAFLGCLAAMIATQVVVALAMR